MALTPDYDSDPGRWRAWQSAGDVQDVIGPELQGPVLDAGCGEGRLGRTLAEGVGWVGVDRSWTQLAESTLRPLVQGDMVSLPFPDGVFATVTHLWCLYHLYDPLVAVREARRVLQAGGRYYACTSARTSDPELMWEGYPASSFDAEEAAAIVGQVFPSVVEERWDEPMYELTSHAEVVAYCHSHFIPVERADEVDVPLRLTKRGVLLRAMAD